MNGSVDARNMLIEEDNMGILPKYMNLTSAMDYMQNVSIFLTKSLQFYRFQTYGIADASIKLCGGSNWFENHDFSIPDYNSNVVIQKFIHESKVCSSVDYFKDLKII